MLWLAKNKHGCSLRELLDLQVETVIQLCHRLSPL